MGVFGNPNGDPTRVPTSSSRGRTSPRLTGCGSLRRAAAAARSTAGYEGGGGGGGEVGRVDGEAGDGEVGAAAARSDASKCRSRSAAPDLQASGPITMGFRA